MDRLLQKLFNFWVKDAALKMQKHNEMNISLHVGSFNPEI